MASARITPGDFKDVNAEELQSKLKSGGDGAHCKGLGRTVAGSGFDEEQKAMGWL